MVSMSKYLQTPAADFQIGNSVKFKTFVGKVHSLQHVLPNTRS